MSTETAPLELVPDAAAELAVVVQKYELANETAAGLRASFAPLFKEASELVQESRNIVVTDASQKLKIQQAALCRKALKANRLAAEKLKDSLKRDSLRYANAVQGLYNYHLLVVSDEEERLKKQEDFVAIKEAQRKAQLKIDREAALALFGIDTTFYQLAEMSDEAWAQLLENTRAAHEAKIEAARKAEEERIRQENERLKEQERIREENARLKREAEEREAAAKVERARLEAERKAAEEAARKEREAAEAALREERRKAEEAAKAERERVARELAEQKRLADEKAAAERAEFERKSEELATAARKEALRLQAIREVERQKEEAARIEAEAKAKAEREAREKLEQEKRDREAAELKRKQAEDAAREAAAAAPDQHKLLVVAEDLRAIEIPAMSSRKGKLLRLGTLERITELAQSIEDDANNLNAK
jgi:hypothetical protein